MPQFIQLINFSEKQWLMYFEMIQKLRSRHYPEIYDPAQTAEQFKNEWLKYYEAYRTRSFEQWAFFDESKPAGWAGFFLDNRSASFNFESPDKNISKDSLITILGKVYEYMQKHQINDIYHWTFAERKIAALKSINTPVHEEMIDTVLYRSEMNKEFYEEIISETDLSGCTLKFCEEVPDELWDNFTELMYDIIDDYRSLNPVKHDGKRIEKKDWQLKLKSETLSGAKMQMYMLLTPDHKIAAYCSLFIDKNNRETIRHGGGFTAVARDHRGKGFAKFLKAKIYLKLLDENRDFTKIETDTMPWNKYMYRINEEFGFIPFKYGYEFKLTNEFIKNYLNIL